MNVLKKWSFSALLILVILNISYGQKKLSNEDLFRRYLISQNLLVAKQIIANKDGLYSLFCEADLSVNADKKIEGFSAFIGLMPKYGLIQAYNRRGAAFISLQKTNEAFDDFKSSLLLDSTNADTYYYSAAAYMDLKNFDSAIYYLDQAIRLNPVFESAYHLRGNAYYDQRKYQKALADFSKEIKMDKKNDLAYKLRGFVYNEMGNYPNAIKDWKKAEKLNPDNDKLLDGYINEAVMKLRSE